jgi:glyoxylase-like metal-dependent hydrolase (beta-lactamase superfamily II)
MTPNVQAFFDKATNTVTYLVSDPATKAAAIIDPVLDFDPKAARVSTTSADALLTALADQKLALAWILETHAHADHLSAADYLRSKTGAKVVIGAHIRTVQEAFGALFETQADGRVFDRLVEEGETLPLGALEISVLHTPGHTPACVTYRIGDAAFVGDTLFMPDYGTARCDFPGGSASTLYQSIQKVLALPADTTLYLCHDYPPEGREPQCVTTVAAQKASNVHVHDGVSEVDFVALRRARDATLAMPVLLLPSVQVNMRAGHMPPPEDNGVRYLKIPVDML